MDTTTLLAEYQAALPLYLQDRTAYRARIAELEAQWRLYLEATYLPEHAGPATRDALFFRAWDEGHASGYQEVEQRYADLAELVSTALTQQ